MKFRTLLSSLIAATSLNANAALIDYTSTFTDNGNKVTEVRTFNDNSVQTWEWLDLTVTNGISYNSLVADLDNDGLLNNSDNILSANDGAKLDVDALADADQFGWNTVSDNGVIDLFNAYFGTTLIDDQYHYFLSNTAIVEEFIAMFGDTYHEGRIDNGDDNGLNGDGKNSAYTLGMTSTNADRLNYVEAAYVYDGQFQHSDNDNSSDFLGTEDLKRANDVKYQNGTWLRRELPEGLVTEVSEPTSMALFALALSGLLARRRRLI